MTQVGAPFESLLETLARDPAAEIGRGASEEQIDLAEAVLAVHFPADFRRFLQRIGWGGRDDWEIFGIGDDVPEFLELVAITVQERTTYGPNLPSGFVPVLNDGGMSLYCLDTSAGDGQHCPVVAWDLEAPTNGSEIVSESFSSWISELLSG